MALHTYDPSQVVVTYGGVIISGFADGEFLNIDQDNESFTMISGADGKASRAKSSDFTGTVTITLAQTSESNKYLTGVHNQDKASNSGALPLQIHDLSGNSIAFAPQAYIEKMPTVSYGKEVGERAWTLKCADLDIFEGGTEPLN